MKCFTPSREANRENRSQSHFVAVSFQVVGIVAIFPRHRVQKSNPATPKHIQRNRQTRISVQEWTFLFRLWRCACHGVLKSFPAACRTIIRWTRIRCGDLLYCPYKTPSDFQPKAGQTLYVQRFAADPAIYHGVSCGLSLPLPPCDSLQLSPAIVACPAGQVKRPRESSSSSVVGFALLGEGEYPPDREARSRRTKRACRPCKPLAKAWPSCSGEFAYSSPHRCHLERVHPLQTQMRWCVVHTLLYCLLGSG